jgi:hypothetical protein
MDKFEASDLTFQKVGKGIFIKDERRTSKAPLAIGEQALVRRRRIEHGM